MTDPLRIFGGWDKREAEAYEVCAHSIRRHASVPVEITPLRLAELSEGDRPLYTRPLDPRASTEFTYTRFLVPLLAGFEGWALYCDCDFLFLDDVDKLFAEARVRAAVMCVKHDHVPRKRVKMDGVGQSIYPRKNWSSLMLFNCEHPSTRRLHKHAVNTAEPAYLHQMQWAHDREIGELSEGWNWLSGVSPTTVRGFLIDKSVPPHAIHFTNGIPTMPGHENDPHADRWRAERDLMRTAAAAA
jgi:hypothetical protein